MHTNVLMKDIKLIGNYDENVSQEIQEAILARASILEDKILLYREIPNMTPYTIALMFSEMDRLSRQYEPCGYIINLEEANMPNAKARQMINIRFKETLNNVKHVSFVTGKNFLLNAAARFAMNQTALNSFTIHKTQDQAVSKLKEILHEF